MGCKSSVFVRPQVLPEIIISLVWVSQQEIEALVNATDTLEITRREPGITWATTPTTTYATTTLPTDDHEEKEAEPTAEQTRQGQIYHIQTKALDRPVKYTSQIRLMVLPFGFQFLGTEGYDVAPGLQFVARHAVVIALPLVPVLPRRLLREIYVREDTATSATESLGHVLAGVDRFAFWESNLKELVLWWLSLLRPHWFLVACALVLVLMFILVIILS
ncbi:hypothetical protein N7537_010192 [Penicillium hordei]|uniref:Uncharacterized protein n=1 Tax=Penicillium hordei TaxID=40994 RepID=A0AAD6DUE2_9EURO|nr:uncharacterized protein N7537_010192 [Penicillium hordei]KAJ5593288.1 hypothetical protein N7537_010192 [Penicillium hordei]